MDGSKSPNPTETIGLRTIGSLCLLAFLFGFAVAKYDQLRPRILGWQLKTAVISPELRPDGGFDLSGLEPAFAFIARLRDSGHADEAVRVLVELLDHPDDFTRQIACYLLTECGTAAFDAVPHLARKRDDPSCPASTRRDCRATLDTLKQKMLEHFPAESSASVHTSALISAACNQS